MTARPVIGVYNSDNASDITGHVTLPGVFQAPIRLDVVQFVHSNLAKNRRQPHGVDPKAGMKHAAESWGTGRAVARIPRVSGSGTHRSGQAAFGNMCRKGRMFAPLKIWRRWHRRVNLKQKRHAVASALAASAIVPLVMARGHRIGQVHQVPLVVDNRIENYEKTKQAVEFLERIGAYEDVQKVVDHKNLRAGQGKLRNRRYNLRKGPLIIYANENVKLNQAFRNIPGIEVCNVHRLNLQQLAPGGQLGRFIIWTQDAFNALNHIFGTFRQAAQEKEGYHLQRPFMTNADLARIINSNEVQEAIKPRGSTQVHHEIQKKNPLHNIKALARLNPYAAAQKQQERQRNEENRKRREEAIRAKRGLTAQQKAEHKKRKHASKQWFSKIVDGLEVAAQKTEDYREQIRQQYAEEKPQEEGEGQE